MWRGVECEKWEMGSLQKKMRSVENRESRQKWKIGNVGNEKYGTLI